MSSLFRKRKLRKSRATQAKLSKGIRTNMAVHPVVTASIIAAIAVVSWTIIFLGWRIIMKK